MFVEGFLCHSIERCCLVDRSVVYQHIEGPESLERLWDQRGRRVDLRHISAQCDGMTARGFNLLYDPGCANFALEIIDDDFGTVLGEARSYRRSDPPRAARHQRNPFC